MPSATLVLIGLSLAGLVNAAHLYYQYWKEKRGLGKMYCLVGTNCSAVVNSPFGQTLGIKNELIGLGFYSLILTALLIPLPLPKEILLLVVTVGEIFSLRLLLIQLMVLKKHCSWCLLSILINTLIFGFYLWG